MQLCCVPHEVSHEISEYLVSVITQRVFCVSISPTQLCHRLYIIQFLPQLNATHFTPGEIEFNSVTVLQCRSWCRECTAAHCNADVGAVDYERIEQLILMHVQYAGTILCYHLVESEIRSIDCEIWREKGMNFFSYCFENPSNAHNNFGRTGPSQLRFSAKCTFPNEHLNQIETTWEFYTFDFRMISLDCDTLLCVNCMHFINYFSHFMHFIN